MQSPPPTSLLRSACHWWSDAVALHGPLAASRQLITALWEFLCDSTPSRRRQRYGDIDFDWDHRVNTTSAVVGWGDRFMGVFHSAYQPTDPALFHEMLGALLEQVHCRQNPDFSNFTFIDLGSGKGRALLMASDYPFRRILGVELLPALDRIAQQNLAKYRGSSQRSISVDSICADAAEFEFPAEPTVLYLFNPFPESGLRRTLANLHKSLRAHPRAVYVLYHNPLLEHVLSECAFLRKIRGTDQYSIYEAVVDDHALNAPNP